MSILFEMLCSDGSCCCVPPGFTVWFISLIGLLTSFLDSATKEDDAKTNPRLSSFKKILASLFQAANLVLLFGCFAENALLMQVYLCFTMSYVVMGLVIALGEYLIRFHEGLTRFWAFVTEVALLFALFRCLPLVDTYRKHLEDLTHQVS